MAQGSAKLIEMQACREVHIDIPKSAAAGVEEDIDHADLYYIWTASTIRRAVGTIASCMRGGDARVPRARAGQVVDWWPDLVTHEGAFWKDGHFTIQETGYGVRA